MSGCRIGRVRMKNGGADVRVLHTPVREDDGENWNGKMIANARHLADFGPVASYVVVAVYEDGTYALGWRGDPELTRIPRMAWPSFVAEIMRREIITAEEVRHVIDNEYAG